MAIPSRPEDLGVPLDTAGIAPGEQVFVRRATGLVREGSTLDAAIYNLMWSGIPIALTLLFLFGTAFYADANLSLAIVLAALLCLPIALTYAFLASAMPRSGGDYVWVSRAVHPALGFMSNLSFNFWMIYFFGVYATLLGAWGMSALFRVLAAYTGQRGFLDTASFFVSEWGVFLLGCSLIIVMGGLFILNRGMAMFFRAQRWAFVLWLVGAILLTTVALLFAGAAGFVERFDSYVAALGGPTDAHAAALQAGAAPAVSATFAGSLLLVTIPYYTMGFIFQSAYFGGEIKRGRGTHLGSMAGSLVLAAVIMLVVVWVALATVGRDFLAALGLASDPAAYGLAFAPLFPELGAIASGNLLIGFLIALGFTVGFVAWIPQTTILVSRGLFAWSFDRLIPERVAEVNPRTHSPVVATVTIMALALVSVAILAFNPE
ncbi:MAG: amino acid permease, partial [Thermomicrobiales bacterium]